MMKSPAEEFKDLLESKCALFKKMETLLVEQKKLLERNDIDGLNSKSRESDEIVAALKDIDYEIARLESQADFAEIAGDRHEDRELKNLLNKAIGYARKNEALTKELAERLMQARREIKEKIEGTVTMSRITGYRPYSTNPPIYVDKRN
jgi:hypothetical protein